MKEKIRERERESYIMIFIVTKAKFLMRWWMTKNKIGQVWKKRFKSFCLHETNRGGQEMDISSNYDMNSNHTSKEVKIIAFLLATCKKKIFITI